MNRQNPLDAPRRIIYTTGAWYVLPNDHCRGRPKTRPRPDRASIAKGGPAMARITSAFTALLLLLLFLAGSTPVAAQTPPGEGGGGAGGAAPATTAGALSILPGNLTAELVTGQVATYTLLIEASSEVTGVQAIPLDLYRSDNKGILPASKITIGLPETPLTLTAGVPLTVPLQIDLRNVPGGEFGGSLLVNYGGGRVSLPMIVRAKDDW